jgi:hypothetical protein
MEETRTKGENIISALRERSDHHITELANKATARIRADGGLKHKKEPDASI